MSEIPGVTTRWEDNDGLPLERQLADVMVGILVAAEHAHRRWLEKQAAWERERREEEERAAIRRREEAEKRERERLAAIEKAKVDALLSDAQAWRTANNLRDYIQAVDDAAGERIGTPEFEAWSRWASNEADKLDPIGSGRAWEGLASTGGEDEGRDALRASESAGANGYSE
jgi:hypothetical protein